MARTFHASEAHVGLVAVATQVGYAIGLLSLVPLGDVLERRGLMTRMYGAVSMALLMAAIAPTLGTLVLASVVIGIFASVTHVALPIAPDLVGDAERGRAIGVVMTGLLLGVLLARTFAGWVANIHGWRWVFVAAAVLNAAFVPLLWRRMPQLAPRQELGYREAMRSLWGLWRGQPALRETCLVGGLMFASFSCFWTTLAFLLESQYGLGSGVAGSFGIVGAAGAMAASFSGKAADRRGSRWVASIGLSTLALSFVLVWLAVVLRLPVWAHLTILVAGVIVQDLGAQMTQISNQTRIFGLVPGARSRINTVYMVVYFIGAALGSWLSALAWTRFGWNGVITLSLGFLALAGLRHATGLRVERA